MIAEAPRHRDRPYPPPDPRTRPRTPEASSAPGAGQGDSLPAVFTTTTTTRTPAMSLSARSSAPSVARRCAHLALVGAGLSASVYGLCHLDATDLLLPRGATPPGAEKGGHAQFLTVCSLYLTAATQGLSILATLLGSRILKNIHTVALALSLPLEVVVSALFWPLYLYDSRLVRVLSFHRALQVGCVRFFSSAHVR